MGQINTSALREFALQAIGKDSTTKKRVFEFAKSYFLEKKNEMLEEFDSHVVTQEIEEGINGSNISNTLGGLGGGNHREVSELNPNLFTWIGFPENSRPTKDLRDELARETRFAEIPKIDKDGTKLRFSFGVFAPSKGNIDSATPMPWGTKQSWVRGVENGMSGLNFYIYWRRFKESRSGGGLMAKDSDGNLKEIRRGATFNPIRYISEILEHFKGKF